MAHAPGRLDGLKRHMTDALRAPRCLPAWRLRRRHGACGAGMALAAPAWRLLTPAPDHAAA
jgi:hypothetical protein